MKKITVLIIFTAICQYAYAIKEIIVRNCTNSRIKITYSVNNSSYQYYYLESGDFTTLYNEEKHYNFTFSMYMYLCGKSIYHVYNDTKKAGGFSDFSISGSKNKTLTYEIFTAFNHSGTKFLKYKPSFHNAGNLLFDNDDIEGRGNMSINDIVDALLKENF